MAEEKQKLQPGKRYVTVVGKVKINDKSFSGELDSKHSDYIYSRINLGIETAEGNVIYGEMMGGYSQSNPVIYSMNKEDNSPTQINFADRLTPAIVESVADFKLHKVGLHRKEDGDLDVKTFLSPMDVHDYLKENLKDGMEVSVKGQFEYSEYNDDIKRKFIIQNIFLPYQRKEKDENGVETGEILPVQYHASFVQTVLLNEDSFKKITKEDAKEGEVIVSAMAVDYVNKKNGKKIKKNFTFPVAITVKINKEKPEMTEKILNALFKVKKGKIRELTVEGQIYEGYDQQAVTTKDIKLSDEIQELIAMGLYSEEEAKEKMTVRGNKVSKLIFTRPFIKKTDENPNGTLELSDDKYVPEDLFVPMPEEDKQEESISTNEEQDSAPADAEDTSWMASLGL